jgi:hypothetical protein
VAALVTAWLATTPGCIEKSGHTNVKFDAWAQVSKVSWPIDTGLSGVTVQFDFDKVDLHKTEIPGTGLRYYSTTTGRGGVARTGSCSYNLGWRHSLFYEGIRGIAQATYQGVTDVDTQYKQPLVGGSDDDSLPLQEFRFTLLFPDNVPGLPPATPGPDKRP